MNTLSNWCGIDPRAARLDGSTKVYKPLGKGTAASNALGTGDMAAL